MTSEYNEKLCEEIEIDSAKLCQKVAEEHTVFVDSYGNGIALVNGISYRTYHDLAKDYDLDILDYIL